MNVDRGKPAEYGHALIARRYRLTAQRVGLDGRVILDFGCGNGAQTVAFAGHPSRVVGVDIDADDLATFGAALASGGITNILPVRYDGRRLPLRDASVDLVLSYEVLEHVPDESAALGELVRVLRPGGDAVFSVPHKWWIFETHGARLPLLPWNRVPFFSWLPGPLHRRYARARIYRPRDLRRLCAGHGLEVLSMVAVTAPMDSVRVAWLQRALRRSLFRGDSTRCGILATALLVHCRKPPPDPPDHA